MTSAIAAISHKSLGENVVAIFTFVAVIDQRSGIDEGLVVILDRFGLVHEGLVLALDRFGLDEVLVSYSRSLWPRRLPDEIFVAIFGLVVEIKNRQTLEREENEKNRVASTHTGTT